MTGSNMNCEEFDALFSDYLEGTLDAERRTSVERHLGECVRCTGLVRDIDAIRRNASALPDLAPSRDLWAGIESRIAAPVVPLVARPAPRRHLTPAWLGIAAAALIVSTAGITYTLTSRSNGQPPASQIASATTTPTVETVKESTSTGAELPQPAATSVVPTGTQGGRATASTEAPARNPGAVEGVARLASQNPNAEIVYSREISMLQTILQSRKAQLDPATVAIIERNLNIIDAAIEQSKAALARDPASQLLSGQLTHALDKKVELLRTAAMLPLST